MDKREAWLGGSDLFSLSESFSFFFFFILESCPRSDSSQQPLPSFFFLNLHGKYVRFDWDNVKQGQAKAVIIVQFANKKSIVNSYELIMEINFGYLTLESFLPAVASVLTDAPRVTKRRSNPQNLCSNKEEK